MPERLQLLGMPLDVGLTPGSVVQRVFNTPMLVSYLNPFAWSVAQHHPGYAGLLGQFDIVTCDGIAIRNAARRVLGKTPQIVSLDYSGIAPAYLAEGVRRNAGLCLVGGTREAIAGARARLESDFPGIRVEAAYHGYDQGPEAAAEFIAGEQPELVLAGLGMGLQEQFLWRLRSKGWTGSGICVGAFFDRLARRDHDYPEWSVRLNLRFLGNLTRRPAYYLKRYGIDYLPFLKQYARYRLGGARQEDPRR